jgi:hypothetical protein
MSEPLRYKSGRFYAKREKGDQRPGWKPSTKAQHEYAAMMKKLAEVSYAAEQRKKKNPTKAQKRTKARNAARKRGIAGAVKALLHKTNPSAKITGAASGQAERWRAED